MKMHTLNKELIQQLYTKYTFEDYSIPCVKRICWRFGIRKDSYLYDECVSIGAKAYIYTISMCSTKDLNEQWFRGYLYIVTKVYVMCILNTFDQAKQICKENGLKQIDSQDYRV